MAARVLQPGIGLQKLYVVDLKLEIVYVLLFITDIIIHATLIPLLENNNAKY